MLALLNKSIKMETLFVYGTIELAQQQRGNLRSNEQDHCMYAPLSTVIKGTN